MQLGDERPRPLPEEKILMRFTHARRDKVDQFERAVNAGSVPRGRALRRRHQQPQRARSSCAASGGAAAPSSAGGDSGTPSLTAQLRSTLRTEHMHSGSRASYTPNTSA
jgi:hypothetical protein